MIVISGAEGAVLDLTLPTLAEEQEQLVVLVADEEGEGEVPPPPVPPPGPLQDHPSYEFRHANLSLSSVVARFREMCARCYGFPRSLHGGHPKTIKFQLHGHFNVSK